jgi:hypothetical protein
MQILLKSLLFIISLTATNLLAQSSRDYISIVGSSTVYPFSIVVAENFCLSSGLRDLAEVLGPFARVSALIFQMWRILREG